MKIGIKVNTDQLDCLQIWYSFNFSINLSGCYNFDQPQGLYSRMNFMMNA